MESIILKEVREAFKFLYNCGFTEEMHVYDDNNFGNSLTILQSDKFKIKITQDKDQVFIDISSTVDDCTWHDFDIILRLLGNDLKAINRVYSSKMDIKRQISELSKLLKYNYKEISRLFDVKLYASTKEKLKELTHLRAKKMFGLNV